MIAKSLFRGCMAVAACFLTMAGPARAQVTFNSVRVALVPADMPTGLLQRIRDNGYTHVIADLSLYGGTNALRTSAKNAFLGANAYGLKFIPQIQTGSKWSMHWTGIDATLPMNILSTTDDNGRPISYGCPSHASFAHSSGTYDMKMFNAFNSVMTALKQGFDDAKASGLPYPNMDYVSIGHDEPVHGDRLLIGNGNTQFSQPDRDFISRNLASFGNDTGKTYSALIANEVYTRITQIHSRFTNKPKVIISADMWDPQANGGNEKDTYQSGIRIKLVPTNSVGQGIASLPGLNGTEQGVVRGSLVLAPWNYYRVWPWNKDPDNTDAYDADKTLAYMAGSGFSLLYWGTVAFGNDPLDNGGFIVTNAIRNNVSASLSHQSKVLGYIAGYWGVSPPEAGQPTPPGFCGNYSQPGNTCFLTIEYMPMLTQNRLSQSIRKLSRN
jgi:hypothetical protein